MTTTTNFKTGIDIPQWRPNALLPMPDAAGGKCLASDMRNDNSRNPFMLYQTASGGMYLYNPITDDHIYTGGPTTTTWNAGSCAVFHPTQGSRGLLAAGSTTTSINLASIQSSVGGNQLANRGDGIGYRIRIIGKSSGGSGIINERNIVGNSSGSTPTVNLDVALDWTPAAGDSYELLCGRFFLLSSGAYFGAFDMACGVINLSLTGGPGGCQMDGSLLAMSELHVSNDRQPSTGFVYGTSSYDPNGTGLGGALATAKNCIVATASSSTTLTGSAMPSDLQTNEYTNFQIRIVGDTTNPTGVGQRAVITSHTSGATGVFTVTAWPVITPSSTAQFVIENNDDVIFFRGWNLANMYSYSIANNVWSSSAWASNTGNTAQSGSVMAQCFGITRDPGHNRRHSHIFSFRGGGGTALDQFDIAAASNGVWSTNVHFNNNMVQGSLNYFYTGTSGIYDPVTLGGKYLHLYGIQYTGRSLRFNLLTMTLETGTFCRIPPGTPTNGNKMAFNYHIDGSTKIAILHMIIQSTSTMVSQVIQF